MAERAGLSMDPWIRGDVHFRPDRTAEIRRRQGGGWSRNPSRLVLGDVEPQYLVLVPANVDAQLRATTVFGNKAIASLLGESDRGNIMLGGDREASAITTEFNTVFERSWELPSRSIR